MELMKLLGLSSHMSWLDTDFSGLSQDHAPGTKHNMSNFGEDDIPTLLAAALGLGFYTILLGTL